MHPISHHIFIFPFKWDISSGNPKAPLPFEKRCDLDALYRRLSKHPETRIPLQKTGAQSEEAWKKLSWQRYAFQWNSNYNEAVYFLPHVREALFDEGKGSPRVGLQYHISPPDANWTYRIQLADGADFNLQVEEITLNFYNTGIGFLAFHLNNLEYDDPDKILRINDFGRRIYPQFLSRPEQNDRLAAVKGAFLADRISVFADKQLLTESDFTHTLRMDGRRYASEGWLIPAFILDWLPAALDTDDAPRLRHARIRPLLDDRMFLVCWVGHQKWSDAVKIKKDARPHLTNEHWHRLIFVDGQGPGMDNDLLLEQLNQSHTNDRWGGSGTFFGLSRYSFVALMDGGGFSGDVLLPYVKTMYFQIALLCLLQRGSIVRFSEEITRLNAHSKDKNAEKNQEAQEIYRKYLHFINEIYFREVTPQEQGIELYRLLQEKMDIDREVKSLQSEIQDFFNLLKLQTDDRQTDALNTLTVIGSALLAPTLVLAYFGISAFPDIAPEWKETFTWYATLIAAASSVTAFAAAWMWVNAVRYRRWAWPAVAATVAIFVWAACLPYSFPKESAPTPKIEQVEPPK